MYKLGNAWEMNTCVQTCMFLGYKHFQAFPRGVQAWTQVFISQAFLSLYMGNAQALKLLGTTNFFAVQANALRHVTPSIFERCMKIFFCKAYSINLVSV